MSKWDKHFEEQIINKTAGSYDEEAKTILSELFFMLRTEIFEQDEDRMYCGEEFRVKAYLTVMEDFIVQSHLTVFKQIVSDMYKERDDYELLQEEPHAQAEEGGGKL